MRNGLEELFIYKGIRIKIIFSFQENNYVVSVYGYAWPFPNISSQTSLHTCDVKMPLCPRRNRKLLRFLLTVVRNNFKMLIVKRFSQMKKKNLTIIQVVANWWTLLDDLKQRIRDEVTQIFPETLRNVVFSFEKRLDEYLLEMDADLRISFYKN